MEKVVAFLVFCAMISGLVIGVGWVKNIITLYNYAGDVSGEIALRIIGLFVVPLGGIMGYL